MIYMVIYNTNEKGCCIYDERTARDFAKYVTTKEKYPIAILKIKLK